MSRIAVTGSLPGSINENTPLWDWIGHLRISIDPALIRFVEVSGFGANFFDVSLNRSTGVLTITPLARADHEWFVTNNISANITFALRFFMMDGSILESSGSYAVTVLNLDDTPPQGLRFLTGGTVAAGAAGATIGRLQVTDPDTSTGFTFTIREDDDWLFMVVGDTLRLRPGLSIPLADGPQRELVITVSDGTQSAALTLSIGVTALGINNGGTVDLLESHESANGFRWAAPGNLFSMRMSHEIASIRDFGSIIHLQMRDGSGVTVEQPAVIDLMDGYITFSGDGLPGRVWAIYETVLNRDPRHGEMAAAVARLAAGGTTQALVSDLLGSAEFASRFGARSNTGFAELMYTNSVGWTDAGGISFHAGRLDQGRSRVDLVEDFVKWRVESLDHARQRAENGGIFVPRDWVDRLDELTDRQLDAMAIGNWWANQILAGDTRMRDMPDVFNQVMGPQPQLTLFGSQLERLFMTTSAAPAASRWAEALGEELLKRGMSPADYLSDFVRGLNLEETQAHMLPQGIAFQAGW
ncbi:DUF4214 domain-containing protein [Roseococcus sp. SDR]|uniref:DUF4214 domain-containing protein n=1 Tax=Roseococcus sp. SDR TaxID=2835532 RepID=UPI001BCADBAF|nr:DUF4214 domain-containing protein [Roseococcus sp. SDR]MBS7790034.1 DUF4214 domain-containing protein [Roseococcus sp. SDR]MBV1845348.1 DUF4214 domain-containing protein [Roseococcus sp. SDR]